MFHEAVVAGSIGFTVIKLQALGADFTVYSINHMLSCTTPITDDRTYLTVPRITENTFSLIKWSRSAKHVLQGSTWSENRSDGEFALLDVTPDFLRNWFIWRGYTLYHEENWRVYSSTLLTSPPCTLISLFNTV